MPRGHCWPFVLATDHRGLLVLGLSPQAFPPPHGHGQPCENELTPSTLRHLPIPELTTAISSPGRHVPCLRGLGSTVNCHTPPPIGEDGTGPAQRGKTGDGGERLRAEHEERGSRKNMGCEPCESTPPPDVQAQRPQSRARPSRCPAALPSLLWPLPPRDTWTKERRLWGFSSHGEATCSSIVPAVRWASQLDPENESRVTLFSNSLVCRKH